MPRSRSRSFESMTRSVTLLVGAEDAALAQQGVHQGGLPVVDVGDDGDVSQVHKGENVTTPAPYNSLAPMRLLHVAPFYEPAWGTGGMVRAASGLCRALAARGHDVTVVTARLDPGHAAQDVEGGVRVRRFAGPSPLARRLFPWAPGLTGRLASRCCATSRSSTSTATATASR